MNNTNCGHSLEERLNKNHPVQLELSVRGGSQTQKIDSLSHPESIRSANVLRLGLKPESIQACHNILQ